MDSERYSRQVRFTPIGQHGQQRLAQSTVCVLGCGALGSAILEQIVRAGVGRVRFVDRDFVESSNLQRQCLYTEADAQAAMPKAIAAAEHLRAINSAVELDPHVCHVNERNIGQLLTGVHCVIDGSDNFRTRHVLNEACLQAGIPWVYGACVGSYGCAMPIIPGHGPCLRCIQDELPAASDNPTCDTQGVIAPIVHQVAAWQVTWALRLLVGDTVSSELWTTDIWHGHHQQVQVLTWQDPECVACGPNADYPSLAQSEHIGVVLCGRDGVQLQTQAVGSLADFAMSLGEVCTLANDYLVKWQDGEIRGTLFADGRCIVQGTQDEGQARAFVDRYLG